MINPLYLIMRLVIFISVLLNLHLLGNTKAQEITINVKNRPLHEVMKEIQKQQGNSFFFRGENIASTKVSASVYKTQLSQALDKILVGKNLTWYLEDDVIVIAKDKSITPISVENKAQQQTISGRVTDANGNPLSGVTVQLKGANTGVITNENGTYAILNNNARSLVFKYMGYTDVEVDIGNKTQIDISMQQEVSDMDEVIVVGYRTVKRELVNGAVSTIQMADKDKHTITNNSQALYGTSGLWINQAGAKPGRDAATIRIRGVNTLNNSNPLVLLDGIEYDINEIDPANIETITVLKDAAAAIYGSKSSNGVILLTSKNGKSGKTKIEVRNHGALQRASYLPDVVSDPILYMQMRNRAEINSGKLTLTYTQEQIDEYKEGMQIDPSIYPSSDWFDITMKDSYLQQYNAHVSGGTEKYTFSLGAGYMKQDGILIQNDDAKRYSFDAKLTAQATSRLKISAGLSGNLREFNEVGYGTGTIMNVIMRGLPIMSDYHRNNRYGSTWLYTPGRNNIENPRMEVEQGFTYRDYQQTLTNLSLEYKLPFDITYYNTLGYRRKDHFSKDFVPEMFTVDPKTGDIKNFNSTVPRVKDWDSLEKQFTFSHRLVFEKSIQDHNVHFMVGQDYQSNHGRNFQAYNWGFYDNSLSELNALSDYTNAQATGGASMDKLASFYSRAAYDYANKYFIEGSLRYDGSSRFAPGNQWSLFPSVSAGWTVSREDFFQNDFINYFKIRGSVGKLGNQAVSIGAYNSVVNISNSYNYPFGGEISGGAAITALTDRDIKWESTLSYNAGIDLRIGNKLTLKGDYFHKRTYDILRAITIPGQIGGLTGPTVNLGKVDNKGWEVEFDYANSIQKFNYAINGSVSYVKNKVIDINQQQIISGRYIIKEGYSINSYYLYESDGYYQTQEEIDDAAAVYGTRSKLRPGYIKYVNQNEDNYIDDSDKIITGSTIPNYNFGLGLRFGYANLTLDAQFQGVANVDVYPTGNVALPFNNGAGVTEEWARDSWTPSNPNAKLPLLTTVTDAGENFINSTFWLRDASYLRMKNISLAYNISPSFFNRIGVSRATIYVSGQNLLTFSKFDMWDPEMTITKGDLYEYPNLKSYSLGLNINF